MENIPNLKNLGVRQKRLFDFLRENESAWIAFGHSPQWDPHHTQMYAALMVGEDRKKWLPSSLFDGLKKRNLFVLRLRKTWISRFNKEGITLRYELNPDCF